MEQYMTEARMLAAQCWCEDETSGTEMDAALAEVVARKFAPILADAARLRDAMETIASFAPGNGDVCEIIAQRARQALMPNTHAVEIVESSDVCEEAHHTWVPTGIYRREFIGEVGKPGPTDPEEREEVCWCGKRQWVKV